MRTRDRRHEARAAILTLLRLSRKANKSHVRRHAAKTQLMGKESQKTSARSSDAIDESADSLLIGDQPQAADEEIEAQGSNTTTRPSNRDGQDVLTEVAGRLEGTTASRRMMDFTTMEKKRDAILRVGAAPLVYTRTSNVEAELAQMVGEERSPACRHCRRGNGKWAACITVPDYLRGACANCWYGSSGKRCEFLKDKAEAVEGSESGFMEQGKRLGGGRVSERRAAKDLKDMMMYHIEKLESLGFEVLLKRRQ